MSSMNQTIFLDLDMDDSSGRYQHPSPIIQVSRIERVFVEADANANIKIPISFPSLQLRTIVVDRKFFAVLLIPQTEGGFVTRIITSKFNATGQGKTEEEALEDIKAAIGLLKEEESNPSGDVPWPEDCL